MERLLAQLFSQGRGHEVVVDWGGMIGQLASSSGQGGGYEMVVGGGGEVAKVVEPLA